MDVVVAGELDVLAEFDETVDSGDVQAVSANADTSGSTAFT